MGACSRIDTALITPPASEDDTFSLSFLSLSLQGALGRPYTINATIISSTPPAVYCTVLVVSRDCLRPRFLLGAVKEVSGRIE